MILVIWRSSLIVVRCSESSIQNKILLKKEAAQNRAASFLIRLTNNELQNTFF